MGHGGRLSGQFLLASLAVHTFILLSQRKIYSGMRVFDILYTYSLADQEELISLHMAYPPTLFRCFLIHSQFQGIPSQPKRRSLFPSPTHHQPPSQPLQPPASTPTIALNMPSCPLNHLPLNSTSPPPPFPFPSPSPSFLLFASLASPIFHSFSFSNALNSLSSTSILLPFSGMIFCCNTRICLSRSESSVWRVESKDRVAGKGRDRDRLFWGVGEEEEEVEEWVVESSALRVVRVSFREVICCGRSERRVVCREIVS